MEFEGKLNEYENKGGKKKGLIYRIKVGIFIRFYNFFSSNPFAGFLLLLFNASFVYSGWVLSGKLCNMFIPVNDEEENEIGNSLFKSKNN